MTWNAEVFFIHRTLGLCTNLGTSVHKSERNLNAIFMCAFRATDNRSNGCDLQRRYKSEPRVEAHESERLINPQRWFVACVDGARDFVCAQVAQPFDAVR